MKRLAVLLAIASVSCAGGQTRIGKVFDTTWQDDGGRSITTVRERLGGYVVPRGANVAVGVVGDGLVGISLDSGQKWKFAHALDARPFITGQVVVGTGGGSLFALDAGTGRKLWERASGGQVRGAGDDGTTTVVSLAPSTNQGGVLLAIGRDGYVDRQLELDIPAGRPAVAANLAFIPWQNQYVTVYDLASGDEVARATFRHQTSHAIAIDGTLYFGEIGLTRFDDKIGGASKDQASFVDLPSRELPGSPRWLRPGGQVLAKTTDATDSIRLYARPAKGGDKLTIDSDRYYATYYHAVLGFRASAGELAWVRLIGEDAIAGTSYAQGMAVCDRKGGLHFFDAASGAPAGQMSLGAELQSCTMQTDAFSKKPDVAQVQPLVQQISEAIRTKETEMVMIQRFLIRELTGQPGEIATRKLIELATDPRMSSVLMPEVREGLSARRNGLEYMTQALAKRYDYLADVVTPPPVGPIAFALAAMDEKRTAPVLLEYLLDPQTTTDDLKHTALALSKLAGAEQLEGLVTFVALNRCVADDDELIQAMAAVARTILRIEGGKGSARLQAWAADSLTTSAVREMLGGLTRTGTNPPPAK